MANAVFIQNPVSIYKDDPGKAYHFPRRYLNMVRETIGDWVVFYEGRKGAFGYTTIQRVIDVVPDEAIPDHFYAILEQASEWTFEQIVPRANETGQAFEVSLRGEDGRPISGGVSVSAVRRLTKQEFASIFEYGMSEIVGPDAIPRTDALGYDGFADPLRPFEHAVLQEYREEVLTSRKRRDQSFARQVKAAYQGRCAISGLDLRNGGGRAEVEAAHIRPVADKGPDTVRNGLALSGTVHWMFDRGLISIAEDHQILVSHNKVSLENVSRLITSEKKLLLPTDPRHHPHPEYLRYHREEVFGRMA